ncbi:MAG: N-acetylglucosamine-6-phosphate deacetylase [Chloroflexi bacterium]|nr:MAG: N-acetylglucosamine-6-phosphate deacetylase [Chloroflexota bacterium]TMG37614.1 MAG: N-acetylglucosamine-6-phosphate deacetylase [Chloroflexota bacterium]
MSILVRGPVHEVAGPDVGVFVRDGHISWVGAGKSPERADLEIVAEPTELIVPGFIDLQVNGFGGHDAAGGAAEISAISELLPRFGVTSFLPTAISRPLKEAGAFVEATRVASAPGARVLGAHLEGPFLNPTFRGAHDPTALIEPTSEHIDEILNSPPRMMTLAPELPGALEAIRRLDAAGVLVAAGHSGADYEQGERAIEAGVRFGTHLFNAMRAFHHRRPGLVGALLIDVRASVGLIADGQHLHDATCEQVLHLKSPEHVALTTDQTAAAGVPPGNYSLGGRRVVSDGEAVRLEDGTLAGSIATMDELIRRMASLPGMSLEDAVTMASAAPALVLDETRIGTIRPGAFADLVILDREMRVRLTIVSGRVVYRR